jgi:hypothetical protein
VRVDYRIVVDPDAGGLGGLATVHTPSSKLDLRGLTDQLDALGPPARLRVASLLRHGHGVAWLDGVDH